MVFIFSKPLFFLFVLVCIVRASSFPRRWGILASPFVFTKKAPTSQLGTQSARIGLSIWGNLLGVPGQRCQSSAGFSLWRTRVSALSLCSPSCAQKARRQCLGRQVGKSWGVSPLTMPAFSSCICSQHRVPPPPPHPAAPEAPRAGAPLPLHLREKNLWLLPGASWLSLGCREWRGTCSFCILSTVLVSARPCHPARRSLSRACPGVLHADWTPLSRSLFFRLFAFSYFQNSSVPL